MDVHFYKALLLDIHYSLEFLFIQLMNLVRCPQFVEMNLYHLQQ